MRLRGRITGWGTSRTTGGAPCSPTLHSVTDKDTPWLHVDVAGPCDGGLLGQQVQIVVDSPPFTGSELIAAERRRQIAEGGAPGYDAQHAEGELARAARCYITATEAIRTSLVWANETGPEWAEDYPDESQRDDIRADLEVVKADPLGYHYGRDTCGNLKPPSSMSGEWPWPEPWAPSNDPIRNLVQAGALIAAEIDRLQGGAP